MTVRSRLAPLLALPILIAACGGGSASPTPAPTQTVAPTEAPSAAPSPSPTSTPAPTASPALSIAPSTALPAPSSAHGSPAPSGSPLAFHLDPALEEQLPVFLDGQSAHIESFPVRGYLQLLDPTSADSHALRRFLSEIGSDPEAVTVAFATYGAGDEAIAVQAYHAPGARPDRLLAATVYLMRSATGDAAAATVANTQVGNRTLTTVTGTGEDPVTIHILVEGEVAIVTAAPLEQVTSLVDALP